MVLVVVVVAVALGFDYTNGFHDAANAIATAISTRAPTPRVALDGMGAGASPRTIVGCRRGGPWR